MTTLRWSRDQALSAPIASEAGIPFRADQSQPEPILLPPYSSISVRTCPEVKSGHHPFLGLSDFYFLRLDSLYTRTSSIKKRLLLNIQNHKNYQIFQLIQ